MENKINLVEILKDCPNGMELDCTIYEDVILNNIDNSPEHEYPIRIETRNGYLLDLTKYGTYTDIEEAKCVIFPKGKTTWEGFMPPCNFKDGDIIAMENGCGIHIFIYNYTTDEYNGYGYYVVFTSLGKFKINGFCSGRTYRLATEEEKKKLFDAIKANGYKWNEETKTLEKLIEPKFKVGDRVRHKVVNKNDVHEIDRVYDDSYGFVGFPYTIHMKYQDKYELVPNKFDINTLKPFDKVLVRNTNNGTWNGQFYMTYDENDEYLFECTYDCWKQCIPYEGNEHLLGKTDDCDEYFKNWE